MHQLMREPIRLSGLVVAWGLAWSVGGAAESQAVNTWSRFGDGPAGDRTGSVLLYARDASRLLLLGGVHKGVAPVQALDLATAQWSDFATNAPKNPIHPYYQAAYHPKTKTVYCLSNGSIFYSFNAEEKTWQALGPTPALEQLSWLTMACDPEGERLVVVGADKRVENVGWTRTVVYDCGKSRYVLLDGGPVAYGHSAGWMYDTPRRCAYVVTFRGECWAMRIDPPTLSLLERAPGPDPTPKSPP